MPIDMTADAWIVAALWAVLVVYWLGSALRAKRTVGGTAWGRELALRGGIAVVVVTAIEAPAIRRTMIEVQNQIARHALVGLAGVVLCACGVGLALWARIHIGRNWGMPMSRKEQPELITSGPYRFVRHPIYTGILLAMLGAALGQTILWALPLVPIAPYFVYSARREERLMIEQFPEQYPAYRKRTRMLLPFVL